MMDDKKTERSCSNEDLKEGDILLDIGDYQLVVTSVKKTENEMEIKVAKREK